MSLPLSQQTIIEKSRQFVQDYFQLEGTGHDWWHTQRVCKMALKIAEKIQADPFIVEMAALFHDVGDYKFFQGNEKKGLLLINDFLDSLHLSPDVAQNIINIVEHVSFMKTLEHEQTSNSVKKSKAFMAVSDADRLDAMGAIGVARAFTYGGYYRRPIYDPNIPPVKNLSKDEYKTTQAPSINHFYEKLLKLKDMMVTDYAREIALGRDRFLRIFLEQFYSEWEGKR